MTTRGTKVGKKSNFNRYVVIIKEDDPLVSWIEGKVLIGDKATATAIKRILRRMATLEQQGRVPAEF